MRPDTVGKSAFLFLVRWLEKLGLCTLLLIATALALGDSAKFDTVPWIEDLHQIRSAMSEKYANFEWAVFEREIDLSKLFSETEVRLQSAASDADAKAIIDRSLRSIGDGHLRVRWPAPVAGVAGSAHEEPSDVCGAPGYDAIMRGRPLGPHIPGYRPLADDVAQEFPAGLIASGSRKIGVIRIGLFSPKGFPELCASIRDQLHIAPKSQCDQQCMDRLENAEYAAMSRDLALRIRALERLGITVLMIDITENGGGSEWAEAAARIVSPVKLRSERRAGVRGNHWAHHWEHVAQELRQAQARASAADAQQLQDLIPQVEGAEAQARAPCSSAAFWSGHHPDCKWLTPAFYGTELLAKADAASLRSKAWGALVFSPAEYDFEEAVWHGPLVVLVDAGTGSASEEFAAILQDNKAAVIVGAPTAGAGCGHTDGGTPTTLTHSHGVLELPDCARLRLDGSNEVSGIDPDILIGFRATDGMRRKGMRLVPVLERSVAAAAQQSRSR